MGRDGVEKIRAPTSFRTIGRERRHRIGVDETEPFVGILAGRQNLAEDPVLEEVADVASEGWHLESVWVLAVQPNVWRSPAPAAARERRSSVGCSAVLASAVTTEILH